MKERPIIFGGSMVRAILEGKKTQTRRVVKPQPTGVFSGLTAVQINFMKYEPRYNWRDKTGELTAQRKCPYGQPGDQLWVREKFTLECPYDHADGCGNPDHVIYWAAEELSVRESITARWRPSIHMPRWASRVTLAVTGVRVERLWDISLQDAVLEGWPADQYARMTAKALSFSISGHAAVEWFIDLWDGFNAKRGFGWDVNPWVWVVEFEKLG